MCILHELNNPVVLEFLSVVLAAILESRSVAIGNGKIFMSLWLFQRFLPEEDTKTMSPLMMRPKVVNMFDGAIDSTWFLNIKSHCKCEHPVRFD